MSYGISFVNIFWENWLFFYFTALYYIQPCDDDGIKEFRLYGWDAIYVSKLGYPSFRKWLVAWWASNHYLPALMLTIKTMYKLKSYYITSSNVHSQYAVWKLYIFLSLCNILISDISLWYLPQMHSVTHDSIIFYPWNEVIPKSNSIITCFWVYWEYISSSTI